MDVEDAEIVEEVHDDGRTRCCDQCGKEYTFKSAKSKFCSDRCRNIFGASTRKNKLNGADQPASDQGDHGIDDDQDEGTYANQGKRSSSSTQLVSRLPGLRADAQYIIQHQQSTINDLKEIRSRLETKLEKVTDERNDFSKKLERYELERDLNISAKSGLNGLGENPMVMEIVKSAAPALGAWVDKMLNGPPANAAAPGLEGVSPEVQQQVTEISGWYAELEKENQDAVYSILDFFSKAAPDQLPKILQRINNLLKNGTAATSTRQYTGTFN